MKVLFTTTNSLRGYGGGEKWGIKVMNGLVDHGFDVEALYLSYIPHNIERVSMNELLSKFKFKYSEIGYSRGRMVPLHMTERVDYDGYDIIYTSATFYWFLRQFESWSRRSGAKRVFGLHNPVLRKGARLNVLEKLSSKLIPRFDVIHLLDDSQASLFAGYEKKIRMLPYWFIGEPPRLASSNLFDRFTVLFVGRHETSKGFDALVEVARAIPEYMDLVIVGSGSRSNELKQIQRGNVHILGFVEDEELSNYMLRSQALLFPSYSEASSAIPIDALAFGLPVIYRGIPSNWVLQSIGDCKLAESPQEFLSGIGALYESWKKDPDRYFESRKNLQDRIREGGDYIQKFIDKVLLS